ncbi:MAG: hypothetical protein WC043_07535 [Pseudobdellovibrionaceae bacterium]
MTDEILEGILERNARVEQDKAWETSKTRRGMIAGITYVVAGLYMSSLGANLPWLNAFIPVGGYVLSTLSLPIIKNMWLQKIYTKG